ncbi:hypothetical protein [Streptomyces rapamycinicus]|uniref:hypothetical protein n=1 Tax=Streptomyces rapamycinicus TaxID=1226757 RepID=UPI0032D966B7
MTRAGWEGVRLGTGFLLTRIESDTDGWYRWSRSPGPLRPTPFTPAPSALRSALDGLPALPVRPVLGRPVDDRRDYRAPQAHAVAAELSGAAGPFGPLSGERRQQLWHLFAGAGELLRRLHAEVPRPAMAGPPCGTERLASWLRTGEGPGTAPAARRDRRTAGAAEAAAALDWCRASPLPRRTRCSWPAAPPPGPWCPALGPDPAPCS